MKGPGFARVKTFPKPSQHQKPPKKPQPLPYLSPPKKNHVNYVLTRGRHIVGPPEHPQKVSARSDHVYYGSIAAKQTNTQTLFAYIFKSRIKTGYFLNKL